MALSLAHPPRRRIHILTITGQLRIIRVVLGHVALAAAAGSVHVGFDGGGDKVGYGAIGFGGYVTLEKSESDCGPLT